MRGLLAAAAVSLLASACGGSGGSPPAGPAPSPAPVDPCAAAPVEEEASAPFLLPDSAAARDAKRRRPDGSPRWRVLDALWTHREADAAAPVSARPGGEAAPALPGASADIGDIAIVPDEGDLVLPPNPWDLGNLGVRFTPDDAGGYVVRRTEALFRAGRGSSLTLTDDDSAETSIPFTFPFYARPHTRAFVNSDGNITFEEADSASTERNVARLLTGPPRVAPFLADLDPSAGGGVFVHAAPDRLTVTWCGVRGFDSTRTTTVQATLLPAGTIEMAFAASTTLGDAIVGLSPGRTGDFRTVNLSEPEPSGAGGGAIGERFARQPQLDLVALARKFYQGHPDDYDQVVFWTDAPLLTETFAYETTVKNEVRGIGLDIFDLARDFGSAGRLRSLVVMDWLGKYPEDPAQKFLGENNTLSLLGQESGHRWLAFLEFRDRRGEPSDALVGRDRAHWSFFFDSDASLMEGNDIEDLGGGSFRTVAAVRRYSLLDQYAMGLVPESAVRPFFYVEEPVNLSAERTKESAPETGVTFTGTRRTVLIQDVVSLNGPRIPSASASARVHRQAFVYVTGAGRTADPGHVARIDRIRRAWEGFFGRATDDRMRVVTTLR